MAINTLPTEMIGFYKNNAETIIEGSIVPDKRRYVITEEGPRHYIDLDNYDHIDSIPLYWNEALERYGKEFLNSHGLGPWHTYFTYRKLILAFQERNQRNILRLSSDLAHYIADAHVPLHTTSNYNGQLTNQHGIHGFWETRLPELFSTKYDFLVGRAEYQYDPQLIIWQGVLDAHHLVDSVLIIEKLATTTIGEEKKYSFEQSGRNLKPVYSRKYAKVYHEMMPKVEQQMQRSIKMIGDFWFTAWVEAGQPDFAQISNELTVKDTSEISKKLIPNRLHDN